MIRFQGRENTSPGATVGRMVIGAKTIKVGEDLYSNLLLEGHS